MDGLFLMMLAFGIFTGASFFTANMHIRRNQPEAAMQWLHRGGWFFILMALGVLAGILSRHGLISRHVAGAYYFFLLFAFWVAAGIGRLITQIPGLKFGRLPTVVLSVFLFVLGGFICYCVGIVADMILQVSLVCQGIAWLLGFWLGLKPAIQRYRVARAIVRARLEERTARFMGE
ncbi:MAG: hypothetical protein WC734_03005 [Patescibacteria group bacterium]|jgi:hypothetical protein